VFRLVEILDGVRTINLSETDGLDLEAYLLDCDEGVVLVDTGMLPRDVDRIGAELEEMGKEWGGYRSHLHHSQARGPYQEHR